MPPKNTTRKVVNTVTKKKGKALKRKSLPLNVHHSDTEWTTRDAEEPSLRLMMTNMGAFVSTLNTRMEGFEGRQDHVGVQLFPIQCTLPLQVPPPAKIQRYRLAMAETHAPLPDVAVEVRAQVSQCL